MVRRKHSMTKATIFITLIITLNLMGISYGYWQDGLVSEMRVSTGNIKPYFCDKVKVKKAEGMKESKATLKMDRSTEEEYIRFTGVIESGNRGKLTLDYTVVNNGSVPIKFDYEAFDEMNQELLKENLDVIEITKNKPPKNVPLLNYYKGPNKDNMGSLTFQIVAPQEVGEYDFEVKIPYKQWTE